MKLKFLFTISFVTLLSGNMMALPPVDKQQANNILIRTNRVIGHAQMSVKKGQNFTGALSKAVHHERVAKAYFKSGEYEKAIYHSRLARILATDAIKSNKIKLPMDASFSPAEQQLFTEIPDENTLNQEADAQNSEKINDKDLMNGNLGIELNN